MVAKRDREATSSNGQQAKKARFEGGGGGDVSASPVIFVGQLPFKATREELQALFAQCGEVRDVRMGRKTVRAKDGKVTHLFTGAAHVEYATADEAASAAAKFAGMEFQGRTLRADRAAPAAAAGGAAGSKHVRAPTAEPSDTLFVANLPYGYAPADLEAVFAKQRGFAAARAAESATQRGFGYVQFKTVADAQAAVRELNGANFRGRAIRLDYANSRQTTVVKSHANPEAAAVAAADAKTRAVVKKEKQQEQKKHAAVAKAQKAQGVKEVAQASSDESSAEDESSDNGSDCNSSDAEESSDEEVRGAPRSKSDEDSEEDDGSSSSDDSEEANSSSSDEEN